MKIIGLTGGIGSGKSTVAKMFQKLGIPVYIADDEAKRLTNTSKVIRRKLTALLGEKTYIDDKINRKYVADKIFSDAEILSKVNNIIHPKVAAHFRRWVKKQHAPYVIKEAAVLFENGSHLNCDVTILVISPEDVRIKRVMERDDLTKEAVEARIRNQWSDAQKIKLADLIIHNSDLKETRDKVIEIHASLL